MINRRQCGRKTLGLFLVSTLFSFQIFAAKPDVNCAGGLSSLKDNPWVQGMTVKVGARGGWEFTAASKKHFGEQRAALRSNYQSLVSRYAEVNHYIRRLFLAGMLERPILIYGDPGGAKSGIVREFMNVPVPKPDPTDPKKTISEMNRFFIQLHAFISDAQLKGYVDPQSGEVKDAQSLVHRWFVLTDELDKANPAVTGTMLDILNEGEAMHGEVVKKIMAKLMASTMNMTPYEFLDAFAQQSMEPTGRAVLDRFPFKVWVANWIVNDVRRRQVMDAKAIREAEAMAEALANPHLRFGQTQAETVDRASSPLQFVDYGWFGMLVRGQTNYGKESERQNGRGIILTENARTLIDELVRDMRKHFNDRRKASETQRDTAAEDQKEPLYYPPSILSTRTFLTYSYNVVTASILLDLLLLPEEVLPTDKLIELISRPGGIPADEFSVFRVNDFVLAAAPGDVEFIPETARKGSGKPLVFGPELAELSRNPFDRREHWLITSLVQDRTHFVDKYTTRLGKIRQSADNVSSILTKYLGSDYAKNGNVQGIEEILYHLRKASQGRKAP